MKLNKDESAASFFTKIAQVRDQLISIGITIDDDDHVQTMVDGPLRSWELSWHPSMDERINQPLKGFGMIA